MNFFSRIKSLFQTFIAKHSPPPEVQNPPPAQAPLNPSVSAVLQPTNTSTPEPLKPAVSDSVAPLATPLAKPTVPFTVAPKPAFPVDYDGRMFFSQDELDAYKAAVAVRNANLAANDAQTNIEHSAPAVAGKTIDANSLSLEDWKFFYANYRALQLKVAPIAQSQAAYNWMQAQGAFAPVTALVGQKGVGLQKYDGSNYNGPLKALL